jgi:hypothetical protein
LAESALTPRPADERAQVIEIDNPAHALSTNDIVSLYMWTAPLT